MRLLTGVVWGAEVRRNGVVVRALPQNYGIVEVIEPENREPLVSVCVSDEEGNITGGFFMDLLTQECRAWMPTGKVC